MGGREPARFFLLLLAAPYGTRPVTFHVKLTSEQSSTRALHYPVGSAVSTHKCESFREETLEVFGVTAPQRTPRSEPGDLYSRANH